MSTGLHSPFATMECDAISTGISSSALYRSRFPDNHFSHRTSLNNFKRVSQFVPFKPILYLSEQSQIFSDYRSLSNRT